MLLRGNHKFGGPHPYWFVSNDVSKFGDSEVVAIGSNRVE